MDSIFKQATDRSNDPLEKRRKVNAIDEELEAILQRQRSKLKVIGCGGGGNNSINRMADIGITGTETIAINTDAQDLLYSDADLKVLIGKELTGGLGAGADPKIGEEAAKESRNEVKKIVDGSDLVFVTCGLGGGTGTGSLPIVADTAKKAGALTIGVVTLPFTMEGKQRMDNAKRGLEKLQPAVDTLIVIPNDRLLEIVPDVSIVSAFKICDEILVNAVKGIAELITRPGLVNLDFADVKAVMKDGGLAMIGIGDSDGDNRAIEAVERALNNPLIDVDIDGAKGALINICGGTDVTIKECKEIVEAIATKLSPDAKIIWGAQIMKELGETIRAMIVVTGVTAPQIMDYIPVKAKASQTEKKEIEKILGIEFVR